MTLPRLVIVARLVIIAVILLLAVPLRADTRQWSVALADPERPGRVVTAEILAPDQITAPCPVAILGHATLTTSDHYGYLAAALAETGWLVALPTTEDGMPGDQAALADDMQFLARTLRDVAADLPPGVPPVSGGPYALLGHSLGGGAAVLAAAADPDVGAVAVLAPQERHRPSMIHHAAQVTAPVLIVTGDQDCVTPPAEHHWPLHAALGSELKAISVLVGGGHCGFAGFPEPCTEAETACPPDLDPFGQQELTLALVRPWLEWLLRENAAAESHFLNAAGAPGVMTEIAGLPTNVSEVRPVRLSLLGPSTSSGSSRWALELPTAVPVEAAIFDLRGRLLRRVMVGAVVAGRHELSWNGRDRSGRPVAAGVYLLRVQAGPWILQSRVVRLG